MVLLPVGLALLGPLCSEAKDGWVIDRPREGVIVLRNETGKWGSPKLRVAHPACILASKSSCGRD